MWEALQISTGQEDPAQEEDTVHMLGQIRLFELQ